MTYVLSDIHGCFDKYIKMLREIDFSDSDTLYILGDLTDRGPNGMKVVLDASNRGNVVVLRGNHDDTALYMLSGYCKGAQNDKEKTADFEQWLEDGGNTTFMEFCSLSKTDQKNVLRFFSSLPFYSEITVNGTHFFLSHTVPEKRKMLACDRCINSDFIWGEPEYEKKYFKEKYIVTGHTPTGFLDMKSKGKIWRCNNHIAVDCGAVFGQPLGCICLDSMKEYYVK